jgi:shikimate dehydrogenase
LSISGKTKVCALIGDPVGHSLSPRIQNAAFQFLGLDYVYVTFRVELKELGKAIRGVRSLKIHGLNVTMPLKEDVIRHLNQLDKGAEAIGAVNTILNNEGTLMGYNTDGEGTLMSLKASNQGPADKKIVVLGAGGSSRAVSYSLAKEARELVILNRTAGKAEKLARELSKRFGNKVRYGKLCEDQMGKELGDADLLINTTPIGMYPHEEETPVDRSLLRPDLTVFELIYHPLKTRLLREAEAAGAKTIDGLNMLVYQGAASFEIWTNKKAPIDVMMKAARDKSIEA